MIEDLPDVPPAVLLLLSELVFVQGDIDAFRKRVKHLLPELKRQSQVYELENQGRQPAVAGPREFSIYMDGGLNLFDSHGACRQLSCRVMAAERLTRSMGLIADTIWLTDLITEKFCKFGRITNEKIDRVVDDVIVLAVLSPLIFKGIIKFKSPWVPACGRCMERFGQIVDEISGDLLVEFARDFSLNTDNPNVYALDTGDLYSPPLVLRLPTGEGGGAPEIKGYAKALARFAVRSALWTGRDAAIGKGAIFSNSKLGLAGLVRQEGKAMTLPELQKLDQHRNITLPWVSDLSPAQIVELREEASKALPSLREMLAKRLTDSSPDDNADSAGDAIGELRQQAIDVRNELENTSRHAARFWKGAYLTLGLSISAYGVMSEQMVPGLAGLLPSIQLIMNHKTGYEKDVDKIERRPGYVLVKAQDILEHAH